MAAVNTDYIPHIPALPNEGYHPLWSVMIPTFNCAHYLRDTLESVLAQDPGPELMQIEVVDDCSTKDDPEAVVREVGQGRVLFFRQPKNTGAIANFNSCIQRSQGKLVHILHGDDLVQERFYESLGEPFLKDPEIGAAFCRSININEQGHPLLTRRLEQPQAGIWPKALSRLAVSNRIPPSSIVIKRQVYETLGGYDLRLFHSADWEMWVRIASHYAFWYEPKPLALYRVHASSDTSRLFKTGANMQDRRNCIMVFRHYLPPKQADILSRKALGYSVLYALKLTYKLLKAKQWQISLVQLREAGLCLWKLLQPSLI